MKFGFRTQSYPKCLTLATSARNPLARLRGTSFLAHMTTEHKCTVIGGNCSDTAICEQIVNTAASKQDRHNLAVGHDKTLNRIEQDNRFARALPRLAAFTRYVGRCVFCPPRLCDNLHEPPRLPNVLIMIYFMKYQQQENLSDFQDPRPKGAVCCLWKGLHKGPLLAFFGRLGADKCRPVNICLCEELNADRNVQLAVLWFFTAQDKHVADQLKSSCCSFLSQRFQFW